MIRATLCHAQSRMALWVGEVCWENGPFPSVGATLPLEVGVLVLRAPF